MHKLSNYKNLIDWALNAHRNFEAEVSLAERKDEILRELNRGLGTGYKRQHIDNWLSGRKDTPKRVRELLIDELLESEVQYDFPELGRELRRILKT